MDKKTWKMVARNVESGNIDGAIESLEKRLAKEKGDRFKDLLTAGFDNSPVLVLAEINNFIEACQQRFEIRAVYLEMNGFDINHDRWYFDFFGYSTYDAKKLEWLCKWQSERWGEFTLTGLEQVQDDFAWYHKNEVWNDKSQEKLYETAVLLVMTKYVKLIQTALSSGDVAKPIPVLATAHDFDIVGRFLPS